MKTRLLITLLTAFTLYAQDAPVLPKPEPDQAVIIPVKTLTGDSFDRLVRLLAVFNAKFTADKQLKTIVAYGPKDTIAQMRRVIEELDKPGSDAAIGRNIEMTLTLLKCSTKPQASGGALPPDIEAVARQLRAATQYRDIQIWDVVPFRIQEGKFGQQMLRLPGALLDGRAAPSIQFDVLPESIGHKGQSRSVRFERLNLNFKIPVLNKSSVNSIIDSVNYQEVNLHTAGDFVEGQKSVLGKVSGMDDDSAIFVVVALKILD